MSAWRWLVGRARQLKASALVVYYAARDPRTPMLARVLALAVAAYAMSPIDLIPDVIPVLGYLDDLLLVPLGVALVLRLLPPDVLAAAQSRAREAAQRPTSIAAAVVIVLLWLVALAWLWRWLSAALAH